MTVSTGYLGELEKAIRLRFKCKCNAIHRQTAFVHEKTKDNETVWFGDVEVFDLVACKHADRCYAWQDAEDGIRIVTILHNGIVNSARRAVQAAIFSGAQRSMAALGEGSTLIEQRIERAKKALSDGRIKTRDFEAIMQTVRQRPELNSQKRQ